MPLSLHVSTLSTFGDASPMVIPLLTRLHVQVITGRGVDKAQGVSVADLCVLQDQVRASFQGMHNLRDRLDKSDKQADK